MRTCMLLMGLAAASLAGCGKDSPPGGNTETEGGTFTLVVPKTSTTIQQTEQDEVTVSVDRGENFAADVKVTVEPPSGVSATPDSFTLKKGADEQKVVLQAEADASVGKHAVKVAGNPSEGESTSTTFEIEITAASE